MDSNVFIKIHLLFKLEISIHERTLLQYLTISSRDGSITVLDSITHDDSMLAICKL